MLTPTPSIILHHEAWLIHNQVYHQLLWFTKKILSYEAWQVRRPKFNVLNSSQWPFWVVLSDPFKGESSPPDRGWKGHVLNQVSCGNTLSILSGGYKGLNKNSTNLQSSLEARNQHLMQTRFHKWMSEIDSWIQMAKWLNQHDSTQTRIALIANHKNKGRLRKIISLNHNDPFSLTRCWNLNLLKTCPPYMNCEKDALDWKTI